jgi:CMP-N,N'-diacetyllegionaminic acid synthase
MIAKKGLNILGVITARGGSVRVPKKNIKLLAQKPLIGYMIDAAEKSPFLDRVIVSTDCEQIKKVALELGAKVPFNRPKNISGNCASVKVIQHAVRWIEKHDGLRVDVVVTLQPTSPFCLSQDIDKAIEMFIKKRGVTSVFAAMNVEQRPEWMFKLLPNNKVEPYLSGVLKGRRVVRQFLNKLVIPNGAIYVTKRESLFEESALITKDATAYVMPVERSIDIDEEFDFVIAECLMTMNKRND